MINEKFVSKVDGMICPQCEDEIAAALLHTRGIISCNVSYRKSQVTAEYDPEIISAEGIKEVLSAAGYQTGGYYRAYFGHMPVFRRSRSNRTCKGSRSGKRRRPRRTVYNRHTVRSALHRNVRRHHAVAGKRTAL